MFPKRVRPVSFRSSRWLYRSLSIRKYSCSGPHWGMTRFVAVSPKSLRIRTDCFDTSSMDLMSGVFLSRAWPE